MRRVVLLALLLASLAGCATAPVGQRSVDEVRARGSLRGSDLDGDWALTPPGRLQAEAALLRRFDHLLTAVGETGLPALRAYIDREVTREHGPAAAAQVLGHWDAHLARLQGPSGPQPQTASNGYPEPVPVSRAPRKAEPIVRSLLTPEPPAQGDDQPTLHAQRAERFGAIAAERLRQEDAARWDWQRRLALARRELQGLSVADREHRLAQSFSGAELLRARALLGVPP